MSLLTSVEGVVQKVAQYAETLTSAGAVAVSAVDPTTLPPKYAAGVITAAGVIRVAREYVNKGVAEIPVIEAKVNPLVAEAPSLEAKVKTWLESVPTELKAEVAKAVVPAPVLVAPAVDPSSVVPPAGVLAGPGGPAA